MTKFESHTREAPETAFHCRAGRVQFAASDGAQEGRVTVLARSGEPIEHWYWGKIVHDLGGMRVAGEKVGFDWCHFDWEGVIGFGDKFDTTSGDLLITGQLVSFRPDDRAAEILHKGAKGVPYEASIFFDPDNGLRLEFVPERMSAQVNGRQVDGPCLVVREWLLRGVAICPYGADPNTSTQFTQRRDRKYPVTLFALEESAMTKSPATAPAATVEPTTKSAATQLAASGTPPTPTVPTEEKPTVDAAALRGELSKFVAKFGAENGAKWFAEGKSWTEACELHATDLTAQLTAKDKELADAKTKLAAVNVGEAAPAAFGSAEPKDKPGQAPAASSRFHHMSTGLAKFAAGIQLPK